MVFGSTKETCKWSNSSKYLIYLSNVKQHITYHIYLMLRTAYNISIYIYNIYIYIDNISHDLPSTDAKFWDQKRLPQASRRRAERRAPAGRLGPVADFFWVHQLSPTKIQVCVIPKKYVGVRMVNSENYQNPWFEAPVYGLWCMRTATDCGWTAILREMAKEILLLESPGSWILRDSRP
jgi:hypothetical protein